MMVVPGAGLVWNRIQKHKEGCLLFPTDPRAPFTNNEIECDLRPSGGCRAIIATARNRGRNILNTLAHLGPMQSSAQLGE